MMALQYPEQSFAFVRSRTITVPKDLLNTGSSQIRGGVSSVATLININRDLFILHPIKARVLRSFYIRVQPVEDGLVTTSNISDVYEQGETSAQAVSNYLYSLVDEIVWFQEHQESLSPSMLKDFEKLQYHLMLV
jgi:hypothetical protein